MKVYTRYSVGQFSTFVFDLTDQMDKWCVVEVTRASSSKTNIAFMAYQVGHLYADRDGVVVVCNEDSLFCLMRAEEDEHKKITSSVFQAFPINSAQIRCEAVTEEKLTQLSQRVKFMAVTDVNGGLRYLHNARRIRKENVVLIADDDPLIRSLVNAALSPHATVYESKEGGDALALYLEHLPDIVLLDIHMPEISGIHVLSEIMNYDPDAFCVMLSADAVKDKVIGTHKIGSKGFIVKPFSRQKIEAAFLKAPTSVK